MTTHVERSIEVAVPVRTAYDQWTRFEEFPHFMSGVEEVRQVGDAMTHWVAQIAGVRREWDAEIVEQVPDQRIAWRSTSGSKNAGVVTFQPAGGASTRVTLRLDYDPQGVVENVGNALGLVTARVQGDLERFKRFIEARGQETGGWRGEIHGGRTTGQGGQAGMSGGA